MTIFEPNMQRLHPDSIHQKNILFSALNWGYGHAMRSLVLLKKLRKQGNVLHIVGNKEQIALFSSENLEAIYFEHSGYPFHFSGRGNFALDLWKNFFDLKKHYKAEQMLVEQLCIEHNIDLVLADQSLGFHSKKLTSILITHQVQLPLPWWQQPAQWLYDKQLNKFHQLWIPDQVPPANLAGKLSQTKGQNATYLGWLSRFKNPINIPKTFDIGVLVTGPQPYAQHFFEEMCQRFENTDQAVFIIYNGTDLQKWKNVQIFQHQSTADMAKLLCSAKRIISRSGYSTLMDFKALGIEDVELHPTPGQAEQIYLKKRWLNLSK